MGITIHYSGRLKEAEILPALIEEVKDIAQANHWKYHIFETLIAADKFGAEKYDNNIYGILFSPPESEPVWLTFYQTDECVCATVSNFMEIQIKSRTKNSYIIYSQKPNLPDLKFINK